VPGLDCDQVVELVTDLLEGALDPATAERVHDHLALCSGCDVYVDQIRRTVAVIGRVPAEVLSPRARDDLMAAFRGFRRPS